MKTSKMVGLALAAIVLGVSLISCSKDNKAEDGVVNEDSKVDLSGLVITDLKIDKNTFWRREDVGGVIMNGWDEDAYIDFLFQGKTEVLEGVELNVSDYGSLGQKEFLNTNKNIAEHLELKIADISSNYDWIRYNYWNGRASIREDNGVVIINFNNVIFRNEETKATKSLNGHISYRI